MPFELLFPTPERRIIQYPEFIIYGRQADYTREIAAKLIGLDKQVYHSRLPKLERELQGLWLLAFEEIPDGIYELFIRWGNAEVHTHRFRNLVRIPPDHHSITITNPAQDGDDVPRTFIVTGSTDELGNILGRIKTSGGTYLSDGTTMLQPGMFGLWAVQYNNVPVADGYTVEISISGGSTASRIVDVKDI